MKNQQTNEQLNTENTSTPYDDACRTLLTDCSKLIIPVVNEAFGTNHGEAENVTLFNNEFFYTMPDSNQKNGLQILILQLAPCDIIWNARALPISDGTIRCMRGFRRTQCI